MSKPSTAEVFFSYDSSTSICVIHGVQIELCAHDVYFFNIIGGKGILIYSAHVGNDSCPIVPGMAILLKE